MKNDEGQISFIPFTSLKSKICKQIIEKRNIGGRNLKSARSINETKEEEFKSEYFKIRRKSCHCSKCGALNKFQRKNIFLAGNTINKENTVKSLSPLFFKKKVSLSIPVIVKTSKQNFKNL